MIPEHPQPCPHLPAIDRDWPAAALADTARHPDRADHYLAALCCAQSRWQAGLPAQALLMLNRAFACNLADDAGILATAPWPYHALAWILVHAPADAFLGNPRRHFQHLATRMNNHPHRRLRIARAWACWAISRRVLPTLPADEMQLRVENLTEPALATLAAAPVWADRPRELALWLAVASA